MAITTGVETLASFATSASTCAVPDPIVAEPGITAATLLQLTVSCKGSATITTPTGWTLQAGPVTSGTASGNCREAVYTRFGNPGAFTVTFSTTSGGNVSVLPIFGVDTTTPLDATPTTVVDGTANTNRDGPSITTVTAGALLVECWASDAGAAGDITAPAGMTPELSAAAGVRPHAAASEIRSTAGATGTRTATGTASELSVGIAMAYRPAVTFSRTLTHPSAPSKGTALGRSLTVAFAHGGKVFFGYGDTTVSSAPIPLHAYDPVAKTWTLVTTATTDRVGAFGVVGTELWATHDDPAGGGEPSHSRLAGGTVGKQLMLGTVTNLLSANAASFETDASPLVGGDANMVVTSDTTQFVDGAKSAKITRANTTGFAHASLAAANRVACVPGKIYNALATVKAAVASTSLRVDMQWYDSGGALISSTPGPELATNTTTFVQIYGNGVAPANAATAGFRVGYAVNQLLAGSSFYVDKCSLHLYAFQTWTAGGTSAAANWLPVHIYGIATRVAGEHYLCGPIGVTGSPCLMRTIDNGATWTVAVEGAIDSPARYYNVGALNGVIYTVLGSTLNGSTPQESYVYDVGNPCITWNGTTKGVGPVLDGFIKPLNFAGALVYRAVDGRLLSFNGTTVTVRRSGAHTDHYTDGSTLWAWGKDGTVYASTDLSAWTPVVRGPAGLSHDQGSLAVLAGAYYFGTPDGLVNVQEPAATVPYGVAGSHLWLKADALTALTDGVAVAQWDDSTGSLRHARQTVAALQPIYRSSVVKGLPAVRFDGVDDVLAFDDVLSSLTAAEVFLVIKVDADPPPNASRTGLWEMGSVDQAEHFPYTDGLIYDAFGSTVRKPGVATGGSLAQWRIYNVTTAPGEWTSRLDNTQLYTTTSNVVGWPIAPDLGRSSGPFGPYYIDGDVAEFLIFDHALSSTDRQTVYQALADRYLPAQFSASSLSSSTGAVSFKARRYLAVTGPATTSGSASLAARRFLDASGVATTSGTAAFGRPGLSATGAAVSSGSAALRAARLLEVSGLAITSGAAVIGGRGRLSATGLAQSTGAVLLIVRRPLVATGVSATSGSVSFGAGVAIPLFEVPYVESLVPSGPGSLLSPVAGTEIRVSLGVVHPEGDLEVTELGVFGLEDVASADSGGGLTLDIVGMDRSARIRRDRFREPYIVTGGTNAVDAMIALVRRSLPQTSFRFQSTEHSLPNLSWEFGDDPLEALVQMRDSIGYETFFAGDGAYVLRSSAIVVDDPVWSFVEGPSTMVETISRGLTREGVYNGVVQRGENRSTDLAPVQAEAWDTDPTSPTYFDPAFPERSSFGAVPLFHVSEFLTTQVQAQDAANARVRNLRGLSEQVSISARPVPGLEGGDVVHITRGRINVDHAHIIERISLPLRAGMMSVRTRERRL